ncbi:MAG: zf-HC2 domain-containing protein [Thermoanaerobaculia bacterium]
MDCKHLSEIVFLFFDNELEEEARRSVLEHLDGCPGCAREMDHTRRFFILVRQRCVRQSAPDHLRLRILTSFPHRQRTA